MLSGTDGGKQLVLLGAYPRRSWNVGWKQLVLLGACARRRMDAGPHIELHASQALRSRGRDPIQRRVSGSTVLENGARALRSLGSHEPPRRCHHQSVEDFDAEVGPRRKTVLSFDTIAVLCS